MDNGKTLVTLALNHLSCTQKELALRLGVSPAQISKWKNGEHMSDAMAEKLGKLADLGEANHHVVAMAGSVADAEKWERLISYLAGLADSCGESGYCTAPLEDDNELLCEFTLRALCEMGVEIPKPFPAEIDFDYDSMDYETSDQPDVLLESNPHSALIYKIFKSLTDVYGFYAAYIDDIISDDDLKLYDSVACNIEPCLIDLAASKIEVDEKLAPNFREFRHKTREDYAEWLAFAKNAAFKGGVPLRAELLDLVHQDHDSLGVAAEAEAFGFNESRLHPDVYMNELLCGMRAIHQILPKILEKLEIDFVLDDSELRVAAR